MATQYISLWADCQQVQNESSQQYRRCVCVLQSWIYCVDAAPHACTPPPHLPPLDPQRHEKMNKKRKKKQGNRLFPVFKIYRQPSIGMVV